MEIEAEKCSSLVLFESRPKNERDSFEIPLILIKDPDVGLLGALKVGMELNQA